MSQCPREGFGAALLSNSTFRLQRSVRPQLLSKTTIRARTMCRRSDAGASASWTTAEVLIYLVAPAAAFCIVLLRKLPQGPVLHLARWPRMADLAWQIIVAALFKRTKAILDGQQLPGIEVVLTTPTAFSLSRLAKFRLLVGHHSLPAQEIPVMYPIAESFRLSIQAMLLPQFPLNVLGSVLARNRTEVYELLKPADELVYSCRVGETLRVTVKGDTEADLISTATRKSDGKVVWKSTLTVIVLGKYRNKHAGAGAAASSANPDPQTEEQVDTWRLSGAVGRQYGMINGDLNPIHIHALTSRLFGFKRPIAHALFLVAKAEASLRNSGLVKSEYPTVIETEFKRPTLLPAKLAVVHRKGSEGAALHFAVVTSDSPAKDVIVGRVFQGAAIVQGAS